MQEFQQLIKIFLYKKKLFTAACKICRQIGGRYAKPAYRSVQKAGLPYQTVHRRLYFAIPKSMLVKSVKIFAAGRTDCTIR